MTKLIIKRRRILLLKFEFEDFITQNENFEFKNIDETKASTCTTIILLTFRKTVYISGNFIAIESIVEWDVKDAVAEQIATFVDNGGTIITVDENKVKKTTNNSLWRIDT
jgi:hypothetical protein